MTRPIRHSLLLVALGLSGALALQAAPLDRAVPIAQAVPLEVYGRLPHIEDVALSPDGTRIAFVRTQDETRMVAVVSLSSRTMLGGLRMGDVKLRAIEWADNDNLMLTTSATGPPLLLRGREQEWRLLDVYNVGRHRVQHIPAPSFTDTFNPRMLNVISGRVMVRRLGGRTVLFVPCMSLRGGRAPVLLRYDLASGGQRILRAGTPATETWIVDDAGQVTAEEDYDERNQRWSILVNRDGHMREIAAGRESVDLPRLLGLGRSPDALLMEFIEDESSVWRLLSLHDGTLGQPLPERSEFEAPITDQLTYRMIGGVHIDDEIHYVFFDPGMQSVWQSILNAFPGERVEYVSSSADFGRTVVRVEGEKDGLRYVLVDLRAHTAAPVGEVYEGLTRPLEVRRIEYPAGDGLTIPAYLTLPRGRPAQGLPLIVLPHGGPAVRDTAEFDWWSQALADQGYAVLRPNFRGSSLSRPFISAGFGEWGRRMQTDLSDGVRYLARSGIVDPQRVCIVGGSYGGYAALAGVTLDPGVYRCAVSVAGISDLARFLRWQRQPAVENVGLDGRFWSRFMGASSPEDPVLDRISPIHHIDTVSVPVLLIHGRDDTVVPFEQSAIMFDALKRAGKPAQLVTLAHEDHWLSRSETRLQMLKASVAFLLEHNPPS